MKVDSPTQSEQMLTINLLNREFQVKCPPEKVKELKYATQYLNRKMEEVKSSGTVIDYERIIAMAALNISHEFILKDYQQQLQVENITKRIETIQTKIASALNTPKDTTTNE